MTISFVKLRYNLYSTYSLSRPEWSLSLARESPWLNMTQHDSTWLNMTLRDSTWLKFTQNYSKLHKTTQNYSILLNMTHRLSQSGACHWPGRVLLPETGSWKIFCVIFCQERDKDCRLWLLAARRFRRRGKLALAQIEDSDLCWSEQNADHS